MKALFALALLIGMNFSAYAGSCKSCGGCGSKSKDAKEETTEQKEGEAAKESITTSTEKKS